MPVINFIEYASAVAVFAWAFVAGGRYAKWLGGGIVVYGVLTFAFIVSAVGPVVAWANGAGLLVIASFMIAPALLLTFATRPLVELTGHLRPEVRVFESYRRIDRVNRGKAGTPKMPNANEVINAELERLEGMRTPATDRLIDAITALGRPWVDGVHLDDAEWQGRKREMWAAAEAAWGRGWTTRL